MDLPVLHQIIGHKGNVNAWQMAVRAIFVLIYGLLLLRIAGRRIFQRATIFDTILAVLIGATLSRAITGNSPFIETLVATSALVLVYWILVYATYFSTWFGLLLKGRATQLVAHGHINRRAMRRYGLTERDLHEVMREKGIDNIELVKAAYMERNGHVSIVKRE